MKLHTLFLYSLFFIFHDAQAMRLLTRPAIQRIANCTKIVPAGPVLYKPSFGNSTNTENESTSTNIKNNIPTEINVPLDILHIFRKKLIILRDNHFKPHISDIAGDVRVMIHIKTKTTDHPDRNAIAVNDSPDRNAIAAEIAIFFAKQEEQTASVCKKYAGKKDPNSLKMNFNRSDYLYEAKKEAKTKKDPTLLKIPLDVFALNECEESAKNKAVIWRKIATMLQRSTNSHSQASTPNIQHPRPLSDADLLERHARIHEEWAIMEEATELKGDSLISFVRKKSVRFKRLAEEARKNSENNQ